MKKIISLAILAFLFSTIAFAAPSAVYRAFTGNKTLAGLQVNDDPYAAGWNGSLFVPTKNAIYDKIESLTTTNPWVTVSNVTYLNPLTTDNVNIGGTSNIGKLGIVGDTDEVQLAVKANATNTAKVIDYMTSGGTHLWTLAADGTVVSAGTGTESFTFGGGSQSTYVVTANVSGTDTTQTFISGGVQFSGTLSTTALLQPNNAVSVSSNAGTVPVTSAHNTFTNSSAANMTITMATSGAADMQTSIVRIYDASAVAKTITWVNTEDSTVTAPTTSNGSTTLPLEAVFHYNSATSKWRCVGKA